MSLTASCRLAFVILERWRSILVSSQFCLTNVVPVVSPDFVWPGNWWYSPSDGKPDAFWATLIERSAKVREPRPRMFEAAWTDVLDISHNTTSAGHGSPRHATRAIVTLARTQLRGTPVVRMDLRRGFGTLQQRAEPAVPWRCLSSYAGAEGEGGGHEHGLGPLLLRHVRARPSAAHLRLRVSGATTRPAGGQAPSPAVTPHGLTGRCFGKLTPPGCTRGRLSTGTCTRRRWSRPCPPWSWPSPSSSARRSRTTVRHHATSA